ncbi:hypothetical protein P168DRAFT_243939 [Aspergillus campestris IBT 28561]|uniref:Uncharacterized protein n=1 Tax=Aspergillus campestris (strain IBT 28561) TaxID=1392248 RepID=A0A2I1CS91_ASPC2|nr:uncharacterized protein P168DRAFT_243939 [Aspergillus campestris IBT 28561]PKY00483.1 hypothetical protein P168DRAFT_243939 [Aspergillus campestris IBT 28561]
MISTLPPPRPVSVNSLARVSTVASIPFSKTTRSTSAEIQLPDGLLPDLLDQPACQDLEEPVVDGSMVHDEEEPSLDAAPRPSRPEIQFENLPIEIHEAVLDYLFGERTSAYTAAGPGKSTTRTWNKSLRHPRRKVLSNLSLICPVWRWLVQSRIYRHIKIKGTTDELAESARWFQSHPYLTPYVRHVEFWIPVWGKRVAKTPAHHAPARRHVMEHNGLAEVAALQTTVAWEDTDGHNEYKYHYSSQNATLEEILRHVQTSFPDACLLTLEGGHCKRPPMVRHFRDDPTGQSGRWLPVLPGIQTLVMRGAWNIMREYRHWNSLSLALPGVREWHCGYAKPKIEGYETVAHILRRLPSALVHMNITLEGFHNKDTSQSGWLGDGINPPHLCRLLGEVAPQLESLAFTGKVCAGLFRAMRTAASTSPSKSRLKTVDFVVKNCCREKRTAPGLPFFDDFSGITNLNFIHSFEKLVVGAVHSLQVHPALDYLRIRFIDLDSACPPLNPYFQLIGTQCTGLWSEHILETLHDARPEAYFAELADGIYPQYGPNRQIVGAVYPRTRPLSIHARTYKIIADVSKA